jgi:hypothetical protein
LLRSCRPRRAGRGRPPAGAPSAAAARQRLARRQPSSPPTELITGSRGGLVPAHITTHHTTSQQHRGEASCQQCRRPPAHLPTCPPARTPRRLSGPRAGRRPTRAVRPEVQLASRLSCSASWTNWSRASRCAARARALRSAYEHTELLARAAGPAGCRTGYRMGRWVCAWRGRAASRPRADPAVHGCGDPAGERGAGGVRAARGARLPFHQVRRTAGAHGVPYGRRGYAKGAVRRNSRYGCGTSWAKRTEAGVCRGRRLRACCGPANLPSCLGCHAPWAVLQAAACASGVSAGGIAAARVCAPLGPRRTRGASCRRSSTRCAPTCCAWRRAAAWRPSASGPRTAAGRRRGGGHGAGPACGACWGGRAETPAHAAVRGPEAGPAFWRPHGRATTAAHASMRLCLRHRGTGSVADLARPQTRDEA